MTRRPGEHGVALVNVLMVMAVSAALVQAMLSTQETAIDRTIAARDRAQAFALAKGGVASLRSALRRDAQETPASDHLQEPWAQIAQEPVTFDFGTYSVRVSDAQGRFDLNGLQPGAIAHQRVFSALLEVLELPPDLGRQITEIVKAKGPLTSAASLRKFGIAPRLVEALDPYVTALPAGASINLNTAPEPVLAAVFANAVVARSLSARRMKQGFLTRDDLASLGLVQPALAGWRSDVFDVQVSAVVGQTSVGYDRRLLRDPKTGLITDLPRP
ncbi:type II secretion system minor pseudopilin GspK [Roseobacter sp. YSTF-M11]|uniref:Type II secretion system protein K n=1 Tax=Roseobacter insulae TaxID=2859783 RepID=A0A9X1FV37_9RHOB|nr:type II secretion system minor pseudopilin GspK [Roseobacter insulae]MBW4707423.1 type II secretion system minor pseudopilin GspK [Roseobacter insulae]